MTAVDPRMPADVASDIAATFDDLFALIDGWRLRLEERLGSGTALTAAGLDPIVAEFSIPAVADDSLVTGAGFVAVPGVLADAPWHLAWWLREARAGLAPRRLATVEDPRSEQFRDYTTLEWWRVPAATGETHLTGPYVDYLCTDDYAVTITTPVRVGGELVGLVGADALVARLERELLPVLTAGRAPATLVNSSGRVVTSTDPLREPGSILRVAGLTDAIRAAEHAEARLEDGTAVLACGRTSLALVVGR